MRKLLCLSFVLILAMAHNILDHHGMVDKDDYYSETVNSRAIRDCILAANMTQDGDNTVYIPEGMTFSTLPISSLGYIKNIEIIIDGNLLLSKNWRHFQPM